MPPVRPGAQSRTPFPRGLGGACGTHREEGEGGRCKNGQACQTVRLQRVKPLTRAREKKSQKMPPAKVLGQLIRQTLGSLMGAAQAPGATAGLPTPPLQRTCPTS